jgi:hypothetical protein
MSMMEWTVVIGGLAAIAWVNWYFFLAQAAAGKRIPTMWRPGQHLHGKRSMKRQPPHNHVSLSQWQRICDRMKNPWLSENFRRTQDDSRRWQNR